MKNARNLDEQLVIQNDKEILSNIQIVVNRFQVHLDQDIGDPDTYREVIQTLFAATENDEITFYINSDGGDLDSARAMVEGIKATLAHVRVVLIGACHSAASIIAMYAHEIVILDSAYSLIHTATFGSVGNTHNVKAQTDFTVKQIEKVLHDTYDGFLSPDEMDKIKSGVELWFNADEIRVRMVSREKHLDKLDKQAKAKAKVKA